MSVFNVARDVNEHIYSRSPQVKQSKLRSSSHKALYDNTSRGSGGYCGFRGNVSLSRRFIDCWTGLQLIAVLPYVNELAVFMLIVVN